jgi:phosphoribosylformylglycinamidine synthase
LETPVTGGNVSFYNESPTAAVYPTPVIGMLGILEDVTCATTAHFKQAGDEIALLGTNLEEIGGSEYLKTIHSKVAGDCPQLDLKRERAVQAACLQLTGEKLLHSAHDVSDGGLAVALAECCIMDEEHQVGANITLPKYSRADFALFGESQSMVIVSYFPSQRAKIQKICDQHNVPFTVLGNTIEGKLRLAGLVEMDSAKLAEAYYGAIEKIMEQD